MLVSPTPGTGANGSSPSSSSSSPDGGGVGGVDDVSPFTIYTMSSISAFVPLSEMFGYATSLRSSTQGRGQYVMQPSHYEEVPKSIQEAIIDSKNKNA